jgi:mono/diheme cytochrome c family protein
MMQTAHGRAVDLVDCQQPENPGDPVFRSIPLILAVTVSTSLIGCRQDMQNQPKFIPLRGTIFFSDGRSARNQLAGTVARGQVQPGSYFLTGMGKESDGFPFPVTLNILERGEERFNIYCSPCHSRVGDGQGMIVQRGYHQAADFHSERLREAPAGHFFNVITHGYGAMPDYHAELAPADRWAVVAYIRALQLSQNAKISDTVPGAHIVNLVQLAKEEGLPPAFAEEDWMHPATRSPIPAGATPQTAMAPAGMTAFRSARPEEGAASQSGSTSEQKPSGSETKAKVGEQPPAAPMAETAAGDPAAGKQLYAENCQLCHQPNREGMPPMIPALAGIVAKVGGSHIRKTITNGIPTAKPPMPSFGSKLSPADIDNLIAFLKTKP